MKPSNIPKRASAPVDRAIPSTPSPTWPTNITSTSTSSPTWPTLENKPKQPAYTGWDSFCSAVLLSVLAFCTVVMWALWLYSFLVKPTSPAQSIVTTLQFWGAAMLTAASATVSYLDSEYRWKRGVR